jgi:AhpD family alkylhydroperoxidase
MKSKPKLTPASKGRATRKPAKTSVKARKSTAQRFTKPTITPLGFLQDLAAIATEGSTFSKVWVKRELDPAFRETLMVAIARMNDSKYCSWAHHEWALIEGVSEDELAHVEQGDTSGFDERTKVALTFVQELVASRFGKVTAATNRAMDAHFTSEEIEELALVARVMDFANRSSNTFDALISRLGGKPAAKGSPLDEVVMSAAFLAAVPPLLTYFSRASDRPVVDVVGRLVDYTRKMEAEYQKSAVKGAKA